MSQKIQVFSPHFDDATLSCGEHILQWRKQQVNVEVYTVFSQFESKFLSQDSQDFMKRSGSIDAQSFQHARAKEDTKSMKMLGIEKFFWLGFPDGGFRSHHQHPVYPSHAVLFEGEVLDDPDWILRVKKSLQEVIDPNAHVVFPLGVGRHADHLIVRNLLQELVSPDHQILYVDIPYAFTLKNWNFSQLRDVVRKKKSLRWSSPQKVAAVEAYASQIPTLFLLRVGSGTLSSTRVG
jgi:LmbE family N-acetylglucosaminyl deacetylase